MPEKEDLMSLLYTFGNLDIPQLLKTTEIIIIKFITS